MNKRVLKLDERLMLSALYVRNGSVTADIGTDHAYIPIYLISNGISKRVIASDINKGPLNRAILNCKRHGISNVDFFLSDGFENIDCLKLGITDVLICGMGGEMISDIIDREKYLKNSSVRLILQPMTGAEVLRIFLTGSGFNIVDESLCMSNGKLYQIIVTEYCGNKTKLTGIEALAGPRILEKGIDQKYFKDFILMQFNILEKKKNGKEKGGQNIISEEEMINELLCTAENNGFRLI